MNILMIAHDQQALLEQGIEVLKLFAEVRDEEIIIVDNASSDGTREWLENQKAYKYLICDEGLESFAVIINTAMKEFEIEDDILVLTPNYVILPNSLREMQRVLQSEVSIGAVSATMIKCGGEGAGKDFLSAVDYVQKKQEICANQQMLGLPFGAILIKYRMYQELKGFDENLVLPYNIMMDFLFRGILKGFQLYECGNAYFYETAISKDVYRVVETDTDRTILKRKWGMKYFNYKPNPMLLKAIRQKREDSFNVLEVGCDCGANLLGIKNIYPNVELYGVELNAHSAEIAGQVAKVLVGDIEKSENLFHGTKFDYVIFGDVLEHLNEPERMLGFCHQILKTNGKIIASIPNLMHYTVMRELLNGNFTYTDTGLLDRTHIHFFTYKEIVKMFEVQGYAIEKMDEVIQVDAGGAAEEYISKLMQISEGAERHMFETFQYIVTAESVTAGIK